MPFICLARSDIPDGTLQILDLFPNTSQRSDLDPPGQTRYLSRVQNDPVSISSDGVLYRQDAPNEKHIRGLSAYIADNVEAGGATAETQTITIEDGLAADTTITISGPTGDPVVFTAKNGGADPAAQEFNDVDDTGSAAGTAASLVTAINHATSQTLLEDSIGGEDSGETITASADGAVVTITADSRPGTNYLQTEIEESSEEVEVTLGGAAMTRAATTWTAATLKAAAAAVIARCDAGQALDLAGINSALSTSVAGTELTGDSLSVGVVKDILSILSGRGYRVPTGTEVLSDDDVFVGARSGSFTHDIKVFDSKMVMGHIVPNAIGGDTKAVENKPIRDTVEGSSFQQSVFSGQLNKMSSGVTLYPDSDTLPFYPTAYQRNNVASVSNARLVTVYNDDGSLA